LGHGCILSGPPCCSLARSLSLFLSLLLSLFLSHPIRLLSVVPVAAHTHTYIHRSYLLQSFTRLASDIDLLENIGAVEHSPSVGYNTVIAGHILFCSFIFSSIFFAFRWLSSPLLCHSLSLSLSFLFFVLCLVLFLIPFLVLVLGLVYRYTD
jgi:hypothetical protein